MTRILKTDFHLHTHHSDNRDRMTPAEYVTLARRFGYDVLGFCDHHHNLTQPSWAALQAEVRAEIAHLAPNELLLTTGYEATWMAGHLCVLGKETFDGESIVECDRQMWSPANTRILAHPDNNICAWHLPLPVGVQGVEVINGGQDPYSVYAGSPCNGLATYQRYLLLNHKIAAIAQSDCHQRVVFGRAWTGVMVDEDAPLTWETVRVALEQGHTFAAMGDLPIRVWTENGCVPGDHLVEEGANLLLWEAPSGAEVTIYVAGHPVAHFANVDHGSYHLRHNGPHWLLVKRGLAWAVSSPIWVANRRTESAPIRKMLAQNTAVQQAADSLCRRLDWLATMQLGPEQTPYPVERYVEWLGAQLPTAWEESDPAFCGPDDAADWAMARLHAAQAIVTPILQDLCRSQQRTKSLPNGEPSLLVATPHAPLQRGVYRTTIDLPGHWSTPALARADGEVIPSLSTSVPGVRDPLHGYRSRIQMNELVAWLARGEIHEYQMHHCQLTCEGGELRLVVDLWPAALGGVSIPQPALAQQLESLINDPAVERFFVHLRMPKRFVLIFELEAEQGEGPLLLRVVPATGESEAEIEQRAIRFFENGALATDPSELSLVVQLS
jgi:hypothetical protein